MPPKTGGTSMRRLITLITLFIAFGSVRGAELDPKAIHIQLPKDIKWVNNGANQQAILQGDPSKPGLYVVLTKWPPHQNSRPHSHPNDRYLSLIHISEPTRLLSISY